MRMSEIICEISFTSVKSVDSGGADDVGDGKNKESPD
jgi:hypothetical protein